jgi:hypothetical protein
MAALTHHSGRSVHRRAGTRRAGVTTVNIIATADTVLRPALISGAIMIAAIAWSTPAHADPIDSSYANVLNGVGIGNNGPISSAIAQVGQSICPLLVKPGSSLASNAIQAGGNGGLAPTIGGAVAGMVIQAECPNAMTQLANGNLGPLLQLLGMDNASSSPFGLPETGATAPSYAAPPIATNPLQLPGRSS